jgi:membrane peptidoglycan carboxypeptidase
VSTRDFTRPQRSGGPYGGERYGREPDERDRRERFRRGGADTAGRAKGPEDPYGIYRPVGEGAPPSTIARPGAPVRPGGPGRPGGPRRPVPPGTRGGRGGGFFRRLLRGPWTWGRIATIVGIAVGVSIALLAILIGVTYAETPIPSAVSQAALQQNSIVYFDDGKSQVGTFGSTDRQLLTSGQIPAVLRDAVLAAEDRQFYTEGGVSPTGTLRAAYNDFTGGSIQGGSTITQQFVRNYYANIGTQQTISRKLKEIFVSMKLARQKSKAWILTQYLNTIYLGNGAYGVGAASQLYFGIPASNLSVAQAATLAAIIQSPGVYPTPAGHQALVARWHYVLNGMVTMGTLSPQQAAAQKFPKFAGNQQIGDGWSGYNGYIMQAVQNELLTTYHYTQSQINDGGLRIVTTFDKGKMNALYGAVDENKKLMKEGGRGLPWYAHIGAVLEQPGTGAIVAMYSGPGYNAANCAKVNCKFDMALQSREQVGSSFKPYVLAAARTQGMSVKTSVLDGSSPLCVPSDAYPMVYSMPVSSADQTACPNTSNGWFNLSNDPGDSGIGGPQSVVYATAQSLNTAYADLAHRVGTQKVIDMAQQFGVNVGAYSQGGSGLESMRGEVGIALGQAALTVEEQATMFNTLAANGEYTTPHVIRRIVVGTMTTSAKLVHSEALTPDVAADVNYALSFDTTQGTATRAAMTDGRPIIGKTGTTNAAKSAFFIGAIPQYTLAVGIFSNSQNSNMNFESLNGLGGLAGGGYGGRWPSMIWHTYAEEEFAQLPVENFATPDFGGVEWVLIDPRLIPRPDPHPRQTLPVCNRLNPFCGHHGRRTQPCPPGLMLPSCASPPPTGAPTPIPTVPTRGPPVRPPAAAGLVAGSATRTAATAIRRGSG